MSFLGASNLQRLLASTEVIKPFKEQNIKNGAYELSLGEEVFQTDYKPRSVKRIESKEKISIPPGQFALLLTEETVSIPEDKIAFISIKATIKFKGLVNVSGFHVDPGFEGKILFSVYNAGPSIITLSRGAKCFPIWFAELNEKQDYTGEHENQMHIPDGAVEALSQGELTSPNVLSKRIEKVKQETRLVSAIAGIVVTIAITVAVGFWSEANKLKDAIDYGYKKKTEELTLDSVNRSHQNSLKLLRERIDSLERRTGVH